MIDRETIGKAFEAAVHNVPAPTFLSEAETDEYPFVVYDQNVVTINGKDGIVALQSQLTATIVADDPDVAEDIAEAVAEAVVDNMTSYRVIPETLNRDCTNGIWQIELSWTIRQNDKTPAGSGSGSGSGSGA